MQLQAVLFYRVTCMQGSCSCAVRQIRCDRPTLPQLRIAADRIQNELIQDFCRIFLKESIAL